MIKQRQFGNLAAAAAASLRAQDQQDPQRSQQVWREVPWSGRASPRPAAAQQHGGAQAGRALLLPERALAASETAGGNSTGGPVRGGSPGLTERSERKYFIGNHFRPNPRTATKTL